MNKKTITSALIAVAMGLSLGAPSMAVAGDNHKYQQRHGYQDDNGYKHNRHYKQQKRHYKRHRKHNDHRQHYGRSYNNNNYYSRDDDDDEKLLIGLVVGGILGYAINNSQYAY